MAQPPQGSHRALPHSPPLLLSMSLSVETAGLLLVIVAILAFARVNDLPGYLVRFWRLLGPVSSGIEFVGKLQQDVLPFLKTCRDSPEFSDAIKIRIRNFLKDSEKYVLLLSACLLGRSNIPWSCMFLFSAIRVRDRMEDSFAPWKSWDDRNEYVAFVERKLGGLRDEFAVSDCSYVTKPRYLIKCRFCIKICTGRFETRQCKPQCKAQDKLQCKAQDKPRGKAQDKLQCKAQDKPRGKPK